MEKDYNRKKPSHKKTQQKINLENQSYVDQNINL